MDFIRVNQSDLRPLVSDGGYPGGTVKTTLTELVAYIRGKKLKDVETGEQVKAVEVYEYCSYAPSSDAKAAEDRLLNVCAEEQACPFNHHRRSNLPDGEPGIVYVLHD